MNKMVKAVIKGLLPEASNHGLAEAGRVGRHFCL